MENQSAIEIIQDLLLCDQNSSSDYSSSTSLSFPKKNVISDQTNYGIFATFAGAVLVSIVIALTLWAALVQYISRPIKNRSSLTENRRKMIDLLTETMKNSLAKRKYYAETPSKLKYPYMNRIQMGNYPSPVRKVQRQKPERKVFTLRKPVILTTTSRPKYTRRKFITEIKPQELEMISKEYIDSTLKIKPGTNFKPILPNLKAPITTTQRPITPYIDSTIEPPRMASGFKPIIRNYVVSNSDKTIIVPTVQPTRISSGFMPIRRNYIVENNEKTSIHPTEKPLRMPSGFKPIRRNYAVSNSDKTIFEKMSNPYKYETPPKVETLATQYDFNKKKRKYPNNDPYYYELPLHYLYPKPNKFVNSKNENEIESNPHSITALNLKPESRHSSEDNVKRIENKSEFEFLPITTTRSPRPYPILPILSEIKEYNKTHANFPYQYGVAINVKPSEK